jgi:MFS family permease
MRNLRLESANAVNRKVHDSGRFRRRDHVAINALWVGLQFQDAALLAIIVPAIVLKLSPANHTNVLAALSTAVGIAGTAIPPFAGALSDRSRRAGGDRRVQSAIWLLIDALALVVMAMVSTIVALGTVLVVATVALTVTSTIYQVLIPEIVPRRFWGAAAGYRGAMTLLGTIGGLLAAALLPPSVALFLTAALVALSALTLFAVPASPPVDRTPPAAKAIVRNRVDLFVTMIARAWIVLGMALLNTYVLYFFSDVLGIHNASLGTGLVACAALVGAVGSSVVAGVLSDRLDRRLTVCLSGIPMVIAALGFALYPTYDLMFVYSALFGLGFGGVFSVGWALALDAVPEIGDVARDLGIWWTLSQVPTIAAPALGAIIIAHGATPADGYRWMFATAGLCFALGSLTVLFVRKRAPMQGASATP